MKNLNWLLILLICTIVFACRKDDDPKINKIPVKYLLSDEDKSLLNYYDVNSTIKYVDQDEAELVFTTDTSFGVIEKYENCYYCGEELYVQYRCTPNYLPNYSLSVSLHAIDSFSVRLSVAFGTGTFWHERHNDFLFSIFDIDPKCKASIDSTFQNGTSLKYDYYDSLFLRSDIFYNVFHISSSAVDAPTNQTKECYYNNALGVLGFENFDGRLWIREND